MSGYGIIEVVISYFFDCALSGQHTSNHRDKLINGSVERLLKKYFILCFFPEFRWIKIKMLVSDVLAQHAHFQHI